MKSIIKNLSITILFTSGLVSCSNDDISESIYTPTSNVNEDLFSFALKYEDYFIDARFSAETRSGNSLQNININEEAFANMDEELANFCKKHNVFADLSEAQKNNLRISEDSMELMRLDPDVYLEYAKKYKSEAYYDILHQIFKKRRTDFYPDDIINNKDLYLNEKVHILMVLPALHSTNTVGLTRAATSSKSSSKEASAKQQACLKEYEDAKLACMLWFWVDMGLAVGPDIITGGGATLWTVIGSARATQGYVSCENQAYNDYMQCQK